MARSEFEEFKARKTKLTTDELDAFFAELEPVEMVQIEVYFYLEREDGQLSR